MSAKDDPGVSRIPSFPCVGCGHTADAIGSSRGEDCAPAPGDICACISCGLPMLFVEPLPGVLGLRPLTADEFNALPDDAQQELTRIADFALNVFQSSTLPRPPDRRMN
jgi:hypothetical protein